MFLSMVINAKRSFVTIGTGFAVWTESNTIVGSIAMHPWQAGCAPITTQIESSRQKRGLPRGK
jgi:hypothetical protein